MATIEHLGESLTLLSFSSRKSLCENSVVDDWRFVWKNARDSRSAENKYSVLSVYLMYTMRVYLVYLITWCWPSGLPQFKRREKIWKSKDSLLLVVRVFTKNWGLLFSGPTSFGFRFSTPKSWMATIEHLGESLTLLSFSSRKSLCENSVVDARRFVWKDLRNSRRAESEYSRCCTHYRCSRHWVCRLCCSLNSNVKTCFWRFSHNNSTTWTADKHTIGLPTLASRAQPPAQDPEPTIIQREKLKGTRLGSQIVRFSAINIVLHQINLIKRAIVK